jgi:hypothetical protein
VYETARDHAVYGRPHAVLWLYRSYAMSAGMYGCQIWSPGYLSEATAKGTKLHVRHMDFLKRVLGVKRTTQNELVLRETGQLPMNFYWFRAIVKFWNAMQKVCWAQDRCGLLRKVVEADLELHARYPQAECWTRDVCRALRVIGGAEHGAALVKCVKQKRAIELGAFTGALQAYVDSGWDEVRGSGHGGPRDAASTDRRLATYEQWFGVDKGQKIRPPMAPYLSCVMPRERMRCMARFRLSAHDLKVETGRYVGTPYNGRTCDRCSAKPVQDERHIMLECTGFADIRAQFSDIYDRAQGNMKKLMLNSDVYQLAELVTACMERVKPRTVRTVYVPGAANPG